MAREFRQHLIGSGVGVCLWLGGATGLTWSQEAAEKPAEGIPAAVAPVDEKPVEAADIARWIEELDSPKFARRQAASQRLHEAGLPAIEPLEAAAQGVSREVTMRAIDVLKKHAMAGGDAAKEAARTALNRLTQGQHALAARAAQEALKPRPDELPRGVGPQIAPNMMPAIPFPQRPQIRIAMQPVNGMRRVQTRVVNGDKTITVEDNNRKVQLEQKVAGDIKMEITETKDGKQATRKVEAKNEDDLKQKDPDAHKIFQELIPLGGGGRMPGLPPQALPGVPGIPGVPMAPGIPRPARPEVPGIPALPGLPGGNPPGIAPGFDPFGLPQIQIPAIPVVPGQPGVPQNAPAPPAPRKNKTTKKADQGR